VKRAKEPLKQLLTKLGLESSVLGWQAVSLWEGIAGEKIAHHTRAVRFQQGALIIEVDNASWMNELLYMKQELLEEINKHLERPVIKAIVFRPQLMAGKKERMS